MDPIILNREDLPREGNTRELEGMLYGGARISLILVDMGPGQGPRLHKHPYEEVFIVLEGRVQFTVGPRVMELHPGQIAIVPAETPHKFINSGDGPLRQVDIHVSDHFITDWLEE